MSATWRLLPRIEVMMFRPVALVKRPWFGPRSTAKKVRFVRDESGGGGQRRAKRALHCAGAEPVGGHRLVAPKAGGADLGRGGRFPGGDVRLPKLPPARAVR